MPLRTVWSPSGTNGMQSTWRPQAQKLFDPSRDWRLEDICRGVDECVQVSSAYSRRLRASQPPCYHLPALCYLVGLLRAFGSVESVHVCPCPQQQEPVPRSPVIEAQSLSLRGHEVPDSEPEATCLPATMSTMVKFHEDLDLRPHGSASVL